MQSILPELIFLILFIGFISFLLVGRQNLKSNRGNERPDQRAKSGDKRPAPLPEDPTEMQNLLQILKDNKINFADFGKITRVHGRLVYGIQMDESKGEAIWSRLTEILPETGYWPLLLQKDGFQIEENPTDFAYDHVLTPEDLIRQAKKRSTDAYLIKIEDLLADRADQIDKGEYWGDEEIPNRETAKHPPHEIRSNYLAFVPTPHSWQAPAYFFMNNLLNLSDVEMLLVLRHWEKLYGAKIVLFTPKVMELRINRRPESKEEALRLAFEQADFCSGLFELHYTSPEDLAADLMLKDRWEFSWD